jgi:hypothetical protein
MFCRVGLLIEGKVMAMMSECVALPSLNQRTGDQKDVADTILELLKNDCTGREARFQQAAKALKTVAFSATPPCCKILLRRCIQRQFLSSGANFQQLSLRHSCLRFSPAAVDSSFAISVSKYISPLVAMISKPIVLIDKAI